MTGTALAIYLAAAGWVALAWATRGLPWLHRRRTDPHFVPRAVRRAVLRRDGHRCVYCGSRRRLQCDHWRPVAAGGVAVMSNLVTLCARDNLIKSDYWPGRRYHPWPSYAAPALARSIWALTGRYLDELYPYRRRVAA